MDKNKFLSLLMKRFSIDKKSLDKFIKIINLHFKKYQCEITFKTLQTIEDEIDNNINLIDCLNVVIASDINYKLDLNWLWWDSSTFKCDKDEYELLINYKQSNDLLSQEIKYVIENLKTEL